MKKLFLVLLLVFAIGLQVFCAEVTEKNIADGVVYKQIIKDNPNRIINALIIDLNNPKVNLKSVLAQEIIYTDYLKGREGVSSMTNRYNAVAGVNASFYDMSWGSDPLGVQICSGELVSEPTTLIPFAITKDKKAFIDTPTFKGTMYNLTTNQNMSFDIVDGQMVPNSIAVYNYRIGEVTRTKEECTEVVLSTFTPKFSIGKPTYARVQRVNLKSNNSNLFPDNIVVSASGDKANALADFARPGDKLKFTFDFISSAGYDWTKVYESVSGSHILIKDKTPLFTAESDNMKSGEGLFVVPHPRTAIGILPSNKILILTVDGRQDISTGAPFDLLTEIFMEYGAIDAVNLDGGGSTAMSIDGFIVNSPSDPFERNVSNALLVMSDAAVIKAPANLSLQGLPEMLTVGSRYRVSLSDKSIDNKDVIWGIKGSIGFISQTGELVVTKAGKASVIAKVGETLVTVFVESQK